MSIIFNVIMLVIMVPSIINNISIVIIKFTDCPPKRMILRMKMLVVRRINYQVYLILHHDQA